MTKKGPESLNNLTAQEVAKLLQQRLNDPSALARYANEARTASNVTKGHQVRRQRLLLQYEKVRNLSTLIRVWEDTVKPGVAVSYAGTLIKLKPELLTPEVKDAVDRVRQKASVLQTRRAVAITPQQLNYALTKVPEPIARAIVLMWISASRHKDLLRVHQTQAAHIYRGVILLQWAAFKSDRYGIRAVCKFCFIPPRFRHLFKEWNIATYQQVYYHLKKISQDLTVHSLRRGACTLLAEAGFSMEEIGMLTGHTPTTDPHLAVRRYIDPLENQPESQKQLSMSKTLALVLL